MSRRVKRLGEENSALLHQINSQVYTKTEVDNLIAAIDLDDTCIINTDLFGLLGWAQSNWYGHVWGVAFSDAAANIYGNFYIKDGGSFKIRIVHTGTGANAGKTASGKIYVSEHVDLETQAWNLKNAVNWDLNLGNASILNVDEESTAFTVADNAHVGCIWVKDDNAEGAAGDMYVYEFVLVRQ